MRFATAESEVSNFFRKIHMIISFPGGAGGNWLKSVLEEDYIEANTVNFHKHNRWGFVTLSHVLDPAKFDYLLSGNYYFNFFVNVIYKWFHNDMNFTKVKDYKNYYTECVNTAKYICQFDGIKQHIYFDFKHLIDEDKKFYKCILAARPNLELSYVDFIYKKNLFFQTMVDTRDIYENFDNQIWVTFVLGQLMNHQIIPDNFSIYDPENQKLSAEFAKRYYDHCKLIDVHHFDSKVTLPDQLQVEEYKCTID